MAWPSITSEGTTPVFFNMIQQNLVKRGVYGFYLDRYIRSCDYHLTDCSRDVKGKIGGELLLGGTDPTHYKGSLSYVSLSSETYWQFELDG